MKKLKELACGFHSHTHFSLDGASTCKGKLKHAMKLGRPADCITDHGIMSGLADHWMAAEQIQKDKKNPYDIRSIHGIEAYIIDPDRPGKVSKDGTITPNYYHLTIHFKTAKAYEYFCKLTPVMESRAIVKVGEPKPLMTFQELEAISGEITIGSGCLLGPVQKNLLAGRSDLAKHYYEYLRAIAGPGNWWVEIMPHRVTHDWKRPAYDGKVLKTPGEFVPARQRMDANAIDVPFDPDPCTGLIDLQRRPNEFVIEMARKLNDPVIISLDDHFAEVEDKLVQTTRLGNGQDRWKFYGTYASYSSEECAVILTEQLGSSTAEIESWIDNSYKFVELFDKYEFKTAKNRLLLPKVETVYNLQSQNSKEVLGRLIQKYNRMPAVDDPQYPAYKERLDYEISVLADNGTADFLPYIFVLEDAVDYASKVGLAYNTRGSAGGSLIVYLLGISITDPIKYNLPFERFMTLGRILSGSLPDIDTDWEDRGAIIDYIVKKYGENCSLIATDLNLHLKSSILDVERAANGSVSFETQQMCKRIPPVPQGISDHDWLYGYMDKTTQEQVQGFWDTKDAETLKKWAAKNPEMWRTVEKCIGITKTRGVHAGGVVVSPEPVASNMPVVQTKLGTYASAYNMKGTEYIGGVKYDFLGVVALKALSITMKALRDDGVADLKWAEFPYDPKVFTEQVSKGLLASVFQLNTKLVAPFVAKIPPKSIVEMSNLTALCRPGALDADAPNPKFKGTAADYYVACARGEQPIYYIHPDLEPIFKVTYGICIFQEQTLQVFRDLAGYSFADAEEVRRAIGKKDKALMDKHLGVLVEKLIARGWSPEQGRELCETLVASARYSFNCSHSTSYAIVAYNQLYLKQHYPLYYWKGALTAEDDLDKIRSYMGECGHLIKKIDGLKSHPTEWIISDGGLRPPLSLIKGCGAAGAEAIYTIAQELNNEKHETNIAN